jgi:pimeloyl-ACP methyl ester carboxylesterase
MMSSMQEAVSPRVVVTDHWLAHPRGRIFARTWADAAALDGKPAPIVLLHDSLGCVALWRDFPERLAVATGRSVIAYDRPGYGRSDPRSDRLAPTFVSDEAHSGFAAVRAQLGFRKFVLFGHSVGGGMAVHCAVRFPDDCEALITESAQAFVEDRTIDGLQAAKAQFADAGQISRLEKYHGSKARWVLDAWTETWLAPGFASWSLGDALPQVRAPALVIHGTLDEYGSARHPEMIARSCAGPARLALMADTHHVPHRERPEEVVALVHGFLDPGGAPPVRDGHDA